VTPGARGAWTAATVIALTSLVTLYGCARLGPPTGGPPDSAPPEVVSTFPEDGDVGVDLRAPIRVDFNEDMNRETVARAFTITPDVDLKNFRWSGNTILTEPREAFPDSTTFVVRIGESAQDYHNVAMGTAFVFAFSTGESVDRGTVTGLVTFDGAPLNEATVWVCEGPVEPDSLGVLGRCGYEALSGDDGTFRVDNVRPRGSPYDVIAFVDTNGDGRYATGSEAGWVAVNAARVAAFGDSVGGIEVRVVVPRQ
jgi:hypothetical protein